MSDIIASIKAKAEALRAKVTKATTENSDNPKLKPLEQRRRGYKLYSDEATAMGDSAMPYEEWIKGQE